MKIDGATRLFAIVGDPIMQAKTPAFLNPLLAATGANAVIVPFHLPDQEFAQAFGGILSLANLDGLIVTYPFKEKAASVVDALSERARLVGGINVMKRGHDGRWSGDIFDGVGLLRAVAAKTDVAGSRVLLMGAGGAGKAIGFAFAEAGAVAITISDLDQAKATDLAQRVRQAYPGCAARIGTTLAEGHDIVINATPVGMKPGDGLPGVMGRLSSSMTVADIVPRVEKTQLLEEAEKAGAKLIAASAMVEGQASAILEFFEIGVKQ